MTSRHSSWLLAWCFVNVVGCDAESGGASKALEMMSDTDSVGRTAPGVTTSGHSAAASQENTSESTTSVVVTVTDSTPTRTAASTGATTHTIPSETSSSTSSRSDADGGAGGATGETTSGSGSSDVTDLGPCTFEINGALSPDLSTVGIIDWSVDLAGLTEARIEFSLDDPQAGEINVGSGGEIAVDEPQAWLLGLKPGRSYTYRIVVTDGETVCTSPGHKLVTEIDPGAPTMELELGDSAAPRSNGFVVVCMYSGSDARIFDADGDVVWWSEVPRECSRALMDWGGKYMWLMSGNAASGGARSDGEVVRVRMDGSEREPIVGLEYAHHDFAVLPDGGSAFLIGDHEMPNDSGTFLVERAADGTFTTLVRLDGTVFVDTSSYHANALRYYARDDSYTVSDLRLAAIVKLNRQGERLWGTGCSEGTTECLPVLAYGSHGHQVLENGNLLYFGTLGSTPGNNSAYEYSFSAQGVGVTSYLEWSYAPGLLSQILGDVQRLPNGNTLVTFSEAGIIHEVAAEQVLVQSFDTLGRAGYASFRPTLYGPPQ